VRKSLQNEVLSLIFCIITGFIIAAITGPTRISNKWPTEEMTSRGDLENFLISIPVAFFSGLGVAVSMLDDATSSLVGVAISASLLPPAVDAGILWIAFFFASNEDLAYSKQQYREMGVIALSLTLANIVLIWLASMFMFGIKEGLPMEKKEFWDDLKVHRKMSNREAMEEGLKFYRSVAMSRSSDHMNELAKETKDPVADNV